MAEISGSPSRIPTPSGLRRSASVRVRGERPVILYSTSPSPFPSISEDSRPVNTTPSRKDFLKSKSQASGINFRDDDLDSLESFGSAVSRVSNCDCEHSLFGKNGTTYSARTNKYVVHCSGHYCGSEEYLTPTQRANRKVRRLKTLLQLAKEKLVEKDKEIFKLTKEVVELKVYKANISSPASTPSDCRENLPIDTNETLHLHVDTGETLHSFDSPDKTGADESHGGSTKVSPRGKVSPWDMRDSMTATPDNLLSSLADSGQFDDLAPLQLKDSDLPILRTGKKEDVVTMYEVLLKSCKDSHECEKQTLKDANEEKIMNMVDEFEKKVKDIEEGFEQRFRDLLKKNENEKVELVEEFERQIGKERDIGAIKIKSENHCQTEDGYDGSVLEREKLRYEKSLHDMKQSFKDERQLMEMNFDAVMTAEREKFEKAVGTIQSDYEKKFYAITAKTSAAEKKYTELLEKHQKALVEIEKLEEDNAFMKLSIDEQESKQKELYLKMFLKGQEAVKYQIDAEQSPHQLKKSPNVLAPELLVQLKVTQVELENLKDKEYRAQHSDASGISLISAKEALSLWMLAARKAMYKRLSEAHYQEASPSVSVSPNHSLPSNDAQATLQFLKSAVFYFLTDRDNHLQHLRAIENILGFSLQERKDIETRYVH